MALTFTDVPFYLVAAMLKFSGKCRKLSTPVRRAFRRGARTSVDTRRKEQPLPMAQIEVRW
jgi:hypothetical protein